VSINTLIAEENLGQLADGRTVKVYTLGNDAGARARFTNLGAAFIGFTLGDDDADLVLGCDTLKALTEQCAHLGSTVGRYANRIGFGKTTLDGQPLTLEVNSPPHHLHGGPHGFGHQVWDSHITLDDDIPTLTFRYRSPDGEAGFPGDLDVEQVIRLLPDNSVEMRYEASTNRPTLVNLTNHAYFNLAGSTHGSLAGHEFRIHSDRYTEADETALPTGRVLPVADSVMDLREWTDVSDRLAALDDPTLRRAGGYDHNYVFGQENRPEPQLMGEARHGDSGRWLKCFSTLPGLQFYTGNFLEGTPKNDRERYERHGAFCYEPGFWPDSPNHTDFPDCVVRPGTPYRALIRYQFGRD